MVGELRRRGWQIVSPKQAYLDPIARITPDTLFLGQGQVAAVAHARGYKGNLSHRSESENHLDKLFRAIVVRQEGEHLVKRGKGASASVDRGHNGL